ncbi:MAG: AI-2E family transporter, partial [Ferruginibacter sp.]
MTDNISFNDRLRQVLLLALIIFLACVLFSELYIFLPGLLGGVTLYILSRTLYFKLIYQRKWKKGWTALLFLVTYLILISIPIFFAVQMISPKINSLIQNQDKLVTGLKAFSAKLEQSIGIQLLSDENTRSITQRVSSFIPRLLNSTVSVVTNLIMMFFILYYLLVNGREVEKYLNKIIPLKPRNVDKLASETKLMIRANALGIPIICCVQGAVAALGYWIFGVADWGMWGFVTGVFAFFPLVGTMIVWVPLVISMFST